MTLKTYPDVVEETSEALADVLREMVRIRQSDKAEFDNLKGKFIAGRKVTRIPTGSANVLSTDRLGDFTADSNYIYILVDNGGTLSWRRTALSTW